MFSNNIIIISLLNPTLLPFIRSAQETIVINGYRIGFSWKKRTLAVKVYLLTGDLDMYNISFMLQ